jgi:hypothetical protein
VAVVVAALGCHDGRRSQEVRMPDEIEIEARVERYAVGAAIDHFEGGGSASHDATVLVIAAPPELAGRRLRLFHDPPPPADSPWRAPGRTLRFRLHRDDLDPSTEPFAAAARGLTVLE